MQRELRRRLTWPRREWGRFRKWCNVLTNDLCVYYLSVQRGVGAFYSDTGHCMVQYSYHNGEHIAFSVEA